MPKNGFVMRFFGCARWGVGVVGAERSIQLSYGHRMVKARLGMIAHVLQYPFRVHRLFYHIFSPR